LNDLIAIYHLLMGNEDVNVSAVRKSASEAAADCHLLNIAHVQSPAIGQFAKRSRWMCHHRMLESRTMTYEANTPNNWHFSFTFLTHGRCYLADSRSIKYF